MSFRTLNGLESGHPASENIYSTVVGSNSANGVPLSVLSAPGHLFGLRFMTLRKHESWQIKQRLEFIVLCKLVRWELPLALRHHRQVLKGSTLRVVV